MSYSNTPTPIQSRRIELVEKLFILSKESWAEKMSNKGLTEDQFEFAYQKMSEDIRSCVLAGANNYELIRYLNCYNIEIDVETMKESKEIEKIEYMQTMYEPICAKAANDNQIGESVLVAE